MKKILAFLKKQIKYTDAIKKSFKQTLIDKI